VRRQILTESLVLASLGALAATVLARWSARLLRTAVPATLPRAEQMIVGWQVVAAAAIIIVVATAACGLPAWRAARTDVLTVLRAE